ncbi:MAG: leucine-rich repeat protein [Candidatus Azobacteroides sp.]|nr:leucine-rich repeat protein [Candidatus Azobacteroides sp.]
MRNLFLLLVILAGITSGFAQKSGTAGDLTWYISTDTLYISGNGAMPDYSTSLSAPNFSPWTGSWNPALTTVVIEKGVTRIGNSAFYNMLGGLPMFNSLRKIIIPNTVKSIGSNAFYGCRAITEITIPESVESIGYRAFYSTAWETEQPDGVVYAGNVLYTYKGTMPDFTTITVAEGTKGIGGSAFSTYKGLTAIILPEGLKVIGASAFTNCSNLPEITLPASLETIEEGAFSGCAFHEIAIPAAVKYIPERTFYNCSSMKTIVLPENLDSIGQRAFYNCSALLSVEIPKNVKKIEYQTFSGCRALQSVSLPEGLTHIGLDAFVNCNALVTADLPKSLISLGQAAFSGCSRLKTVVIPDGIWEIPHSAFAGCRGMTSLYLPNHITSIGEWAFDDCSGLTDIVLPDSLKVIASQGFYGCSKLEHVDIPDGVISMGESAFSNCSRLKSVVIPFSIKNIENYAFMRCSSLNSIRVAWEAPIPVLSNVFYDVKFESTTLYVPEGTSDAYKAAPVWQEFMVEEVTGVSIEPDETEIIISWYPVEDAIEYLLSLYEDEELTTLLFTYRFGEDGQLIREEKKYDFRSVETGDSKIYSYAIEGLAEDMTYYYSLTAKNSSEEVIKMLTGEFTTDIATGTQDIHTASFSVYPNPVTETIFITGIPENTMITITDLSGLVILTTTEKEIRISEFPSGIYLLKAGEYTRKVIKN